MATTVVRRRRLAREARDDDDESEPADVDDEEDEARPPPAVVVRVRRRVRWVRRRRARSEDVEAAAVEAGVDADTERRGWRVALALAVTFVTFAAFTAFGFRVVGTVAAAAFAASTCQVLPLAIVQPRDGRVGLSRAHMVVNKEAVLVDAPVLQVGHGLALVGVEVH